MCYRLFWFLFNGGIDVQSFPLWVAILLAGICLLSQLFDGEMKFKNSDTCMLAKK